MQTRQLTAAILDAAIEGFEAQKRRIDEQIAQVRQLLNGDRPVGASTSEPQRQPRRKMSAATRKRMGEAQRKRWAAKKAGLVVVKKAAAKKTASRRTVGKKAANAKAAA